MRHNALTPEQVTLLRLLADHDMTGDAMRDAAGFDRASFDEAATGLWKRKLLRGITAQGCCNDPCGSACISANKPQRIWGLSALGNIAQRFTRDAGDITPA